MILFDTETTGLVGPATLPLNKQPEIIEFAAIKLHDDTLEEEDRMEFLCKPANLPLPDKITEITGIKTKDLEDKEPFAAHLKPLCQFFLGQRTIVAHNLKFDVDMLSLELRRLGALHRFPWPYLHICTVERSKKIKGRRMRMGELYTHLTGKEIEGWHRAMADVESLCEIVRELKKLKQ